MIKKEKIKELILKWIGLNFGSQEMEDPCYNVDMLSEYLEKELKNGR